MNYISLFPDRCDNPFYSMALDEILLKQAVLHHSTPPLIRFYTFPEPAVTIGFAQRNRSLIESVSSRGCPWVRRPTGGGLVAHADDLIYALVLPLGLSCRFGNTKYLYAMFHQTIQEALSVFGVVVNLVTTQKHCMIMPDSMVCFENPVESDILFRGRKIAGGAQRRSGRFLLHQGSIHLADVKPAEQTADTFRRHFQAVFASKLARQLKRYVCVGVWEKMLLADADRLMEEKYYFPAWNREGRLPAAAVQMPVPVLAAVS